MSQPNNLDELHKRFTNGEKLNDIAFAMDLDEQQVQKIICEQRKIDPNKWPYRRPKKGMIRSYHIYECEDCCLVFAVEQALEDQSGVMCPVCLDDDQMRTVGHGEMEEILEESS